MDGDRFDDLIKRLGTTRLTRLTALRGLAVGGLAALTGAGLLAEEALAKNNHEQKIRICHRSSATDPGVSKKLKKDKAQKHLKRHPFDTKGRCTATPTPTPTPVTPATTCGAGAPVQCGNTAFCCPSNLPQCCVNAGIAGFSCAPSNYTCCGQQGDACAPSGESCCLPDPSVGGRQSSGCIPEGTVCCPFAESFAVADAQVTAQIDGFGGGFCDRREVFDQGTVDFYFSYFCCPPDAGTDFGRCCPGVAVGDGPVEGGCCTQDDDCPDDTFDCDQNGCCRKLF